MDSGVLRELVRQVLREELVRFRSELGQKDARPLSHGEAAKYLGISESYLYQLTCKGDVPHYKSAGGKKLSYEEEDLQGWLRGQRISGKAEREQEASSEVIQRRMKRQGEK